MLYKFIQYMLFFPNWSIVEWVFAGISIAFFAGLFYALPTLLRLSLIPFFLLEAYFMSPGFACGGSLDMFSRIYHTRSACDQLAYSQYLGANFGFSHWYVVLIYIGLILFMLQPLFKKIFYTNKATLQENLESQISAGTALNKMSGIERIGKI